MGLVYPVACPGHHGVAKHHEGENMEEHLNEDAVWQRMLAAMETVPYIPLNDLDRLRRFVSACFVVMRTNLTWAELGCLAPSAEAAKKRFRHRAKRGVFNLLVSADTEPRRNVSIQCVTALISIETHR